MRQKFSHLRSLPHLQLPHDLLLYWVTWLFRSWSSSILDLLLDDGGSSGFFSGRPKVLEEEDDSEQANDLGLLFDLKELVRDNNHRVDCLPLFSLLEHLKWDLYSADFSGASVSMDETHV